MKILTLSGLDGSGKSTQIELMKDYLKSRDKTFFYFHAVEFSFGNKVLGNKKDKSGKEISVENAGWIKIFLRKIGLIIDIFRFRRLMKKLNVDYIISDRYFYDSVVNIFYLMQRKKSPSIPLFQRGKPDSLPFEKGELERDLCSEKYISKPDFAFYIDVKPEIIMRRERKPDQGMEYLAAKEKLFERKIKDWNMIVIDGEKGKEEIFEDIITTLSLRGAQRQSNLV